MVPPTLTAMATGIVTEPFLDAVRARIPGLRVLTDATDRETYRRDETAYLPAGLPGAVALPTETAAGRRARPGLRRVRRPDRAAWRRAPG